MGTAFSPHDFAPVGPALGRDNLGGRGDQAVENRAANDGVSEDFMIPPIANAWPVRRIDEAARYHFLRGRSSTEFPFGVGLRGCALS